jgi:hypothetical protein
MQRWCSHLETEETMYDWAKLMQSCQDLVTEIAKIRHALHRTNIMKTVDFDGRTYTIDELIGMRTTVIPNRIVLWKSLRRREKSYNDPKEVNVVTHFDHKTRDMEIDKLEDMLDDVDAILDHVNIETELT